MKNKGIWLLYPVLALLLIFSLGVPANAQDDPMPLPHNFYGSVTIGTELAPEETEVEARCEGVVTTTVNPIITTEEGKYGAPGVTGLKLEVKGYIENGTLIEFYVDGNRAECYDVEVQTTSDTYLFKNGEVTELNLTVVGVVSLAAEAGGPYSGAVGASIALSGSASGGTSPYIYAWDLDNDGVYDDAAVATPSYSWEAADTYTVGLQVTDDALATATDTATVTVTEEGAFDPYIYDTNDDGVLSKDETLAAVDDCLAGNITKDDALAVVKLYFS